MYILESLNLRLSYVCLRMCVYTSWYVFANMMSPAQMTTPARTVSKICARTWSDCTAIFFLDLLSWRISGIIEPWSECLPEIIEAFRKTSPLPPTKETQDHQPTLDCRGPQTSQDRTRQPRSSRYLGKRKGRSSYATVLYGILKI